MIEIHCYNCGGFISEPKQISHRVATNAAHGVFAALPHSALCTCTLPVVYGPPAGYASSPSIRAPV